MSEIRFDDRVVLVTGAGRGLGAAYARALAQRGASVIVHDAGVEADGSGGDPSVAQAVADEIGGLACFENLEEPDAGTRVVDEALERFGRLDAVIQNAGLLNCGAIVGSLVHLYRIPCFFLVSYRGDERDPTYYHVPKGRATEPTLDAWSIRYAKAAGPGRIAAQIAQGFLWVEEARAPFALLFSAEDLA